MSFCGLDGHCWGTWLYDWQTMITGALAVGAAAWAASLARGQLGAARDQIETQQGQEQRARAGRLRVARATLPAALSSICQYAQAAAAKLELLHRSDDIYRTMMADSGKGGAVTIPTFPTPALTSLANVLEFVDDATVAERIESILREAQVFDSRNSTIAEDEGTNCLYIEAVIVQAASLYARAESLFGYARNQLPSVDETPLWDGVMAAINRFGLRDQRWDGMRIAARQSCERGETPGEADERPMPEIGC